MLTTIIFFISIAVILAIVIGINISSPIDDPYLYLLFWLMFFVTIATVLNIVFTSYFYMVMRNKKGIRGQQGIRGEKGNSGQLGKCDPDCKNGLCSSSILDHIITVLNREEMRQGRPGDLQQIDIKNVYLKSKIKSICGSAEFQKIAPYKGQDELVKYLKGIWEDIALRIYKSGGLSYFKSVGAENDWDWVANNPWNEFKKYDVYYWGLGKEYRPRIKDSCKPEDAQDKSSAFIQQGAQTDYKMPATKDMKYSIMSYVNLPNFAMDADLAESISVKNNRTSQKLKLYNAYTYEPQPDIKAKYAAGKQAKMAKPVKPMSYLLGIPGQKTACYSFTSSGSTIPKPCDPYDANQIYELEFDNKSGTGQFKIKNSAAGKYISNSANSKYLTLAGRGDVYSAAPASTSSN